jgi:TP901 family phage tail tape measure protein
MGPSFDVHVRFDANTAGLRTARGATEDAGRAAQDLARNVKAAIAAYLGFETAKTVIVGAVRTFAQFEATMSGVKAVTQATTAEMARMTEVAKQLGSSTSFSASEAAAGMKLLGQAGLSTSQILTAIPSMLTLAAAGGLELARATEITTGTLAGFNLAVDQAARVADVLAKAANASNASVESMGEGIKFVAPVASSMGISLEAAAAAMAALSNAGLDGTLSGTGLRRVLSDLVQPSKQAQEALAGLGVNLADINPLTHELTDVLDVFASKNLDAASAFKIFGEQGAPVILALISQRDRLRELNAEMANAGGSAAEMAQTMRDNLAGSLDELAGSAETLAIQFGSGMSEGLRSAADSIGAYFDASGANAQEWGRRLGALTAEVARGIVLVESAVKALIIATLPAAIARLQALFVSLQAQMMATGNAIYVVAAAAAALAFGLDALINKWARASAEATNLAIQMGNAEGRMLEFAQTVKKTGGEVTAAQLAQARKDLESQAKELAAARDSLAKIQKEAKRTILGVAEDEAAAKAQQQLDEAIQRVNRARDVYGKLGKAIAGVTKVSKEAANAPTPPPVPPPVIASVNELADAYKDFQERSRLAHERLMILNSGLVRTAEDVAVMNAAFEAGLDPIKELTGATDDLVRRTLRLEGMADVIAQLFQELPKLGQGIEQQFKDFAPKLVLPTLEANPETAGQIRGITEDLSESVRRYQDGEWTRLWDDVASAAAGALGSGLKQITSDLLDGNLKDWDDWGDAIVGIAKDIAKSVLGTFTDLLTQIIADWAKRKIVASFTGSGSSGNGGDIWGTLGKTAATKAVSGGGLTATGAAVAAILGTVAVFGAIYLAVDKILDRQSKKRTAGTVTLGNARPGDVNIGYKSDALNDALVAIYNDTNAAINQIADITGGTIRLMERVVINVKGTGEAFVHIGDMVRRFGSLAEAVDFARRELLRTADFAGLSPELVKLFQEGNQSWEQLQADIELALRAAGQTLTAAGQQAFDLFNALSLDLRRAAEIDLPSGELLKQFLDDLKKLSNDEGYGDAIAKLRNRIVRELEALKKELERVLKGGFGGGGGAGGGGGTGNRGNVAGAGSGSGGMVNGKLFSVAQDAADAVVVVANAALVASGIQAEALRSVADGAADGVSRLSQADLDLAEQLRRRIAELEGLLKDLPAAGSGGGKGRGGGGGSDRKRDQEQLRETLRDLAESKLPALDQALLEVGREWDENARKAHGNADLLRQVAEARQAEIDALVSAGVRGAYDSILDLEGLSETARQADAIADAAGAAREEFLAAAKAAGFGADRIARGLGRIMAAEERRLQALSDETAAGLATALADIVTDEAIRRDLLHNAEVINLTLRLEALRAEYATLVAMGRLAPEVEAAIAAAFGWIDANLPTILAGLGTSPAANDNEPANTAPLYEFGYALNWAAEAAAEAARRLEEVQRPLIDLRRQLDLGQAGTGATPDQILQNLQARAQELMSAFASATGNARLDIQEQLGAILPDLIAAADNAGSSASVTQWVSTALDRLGIPRYLPGASSQGALTANQPRGNAPTPQELIDSNTLRSIESNQIRMADGFDNLASELRRQRAA